MLIESLYPEFCTQSGDNGNMMYVKACLPDAELVETHLMDRPAFVDRRPDFMYLGNMTELEQERVIADLLPHRERLIELIEDGVPMLVTGNAAELFGSRIVDVRDGEITCLDILPFETRRDMDSRVWGMVMGKFEGFDLIGYKAQFTQAFGQNEGEAVFKCERGFGLNRQSEYEGFHRKNLILTWMLGPLLPSNPRLMRYLLDLMGAPEVPVAFLETAERAYEVRLAEFKDPRIDITD
ncbi:hypothetical protein [Olsenella urininfantis]|uniref:hypothetical protein n=1 Tax=Olsenella urininfantis TaxID=1871033 RepID=UPI0009849898|nr:hypothetical protein [Olsenella urininfantis]